MAGLFARRLLAMQGFVPDLRTSLIVVTGCAALFAFLQLAYMVFLRIFRPWQGGTPLLTEALSHCAVLIMLPYLLHVQIPWPAEILLRIEPLIYLGVFAAPHGFFKLMTLFAVTQAPRASRLGAAGWVAATVLSLCVVAGAFIGWSESLRRARVAIQTPAGPQRSGNTWSLARPLPEGALYTFDLQERGNRQLTLRWANVPGTDAPLETIHVSVQTGGPRSRPLVIPVPLNESDWAEIRLRAADLPPGTVSCTLFWSRAPESPLLAQTGIRPVDASDHTVLVSGPWLHNPAGDTRNPSMILIVVEGLGAEHLSMLGYERETTPALGAFAARALFYPNVYTPAPDASAACMSLLTGLHPLAHGYLGPYHGPLPENAQTLPELLQQRGYATAAFSEGLGNDDEDLVFGSGFERGFECFNPDYPLVTPPSATPGRVEPAGSEITLRRAAEWIEAHQDIQFFIFIRLRELRQFQRLSRYGEGFLGRGRTPTPRDIYDTALADVDKRIGAFLDRIGAAPELANAAIVITSPYGFDFAEPGRGEWRRGGPGIQNLSESSLRVPVFISGAGEATRQRTYAAGLEDLAPALLGLAGGKFPQPITGADMLGATVNREPVSIMGEPLSLSLRTRQFRFTWQSGTFPFAPEQPPVPSYDIELIDLDRYRRKQAPANVLQQQPSMANLLRSRLQDFLSE